MKISGVITEFNPFHNGHKYLIENIKKESDAVVCVMSGSFVQRGDVAVFDKWKRAHAALLNGADLVIELPAVFSTSTAERFAYGAVELISQMCCVDELCFGSESGNISELEYASNILYNENEEVSKKIKLNLDNGKSFPAARQLACDGIIAPEILNNPNNILAIEYITAALKQKSNVKLKTIQRSDNGYHSTNPLGKFAGASIIREFILRDIDYFSFIPKNLTNLYTLSEIYKLSQLNDTIIYMLRKIPCSEFAQLNDVSEGLENRIKELAFEYCDIYTIIEKAVTKRYTRTKIMRILISLLLDINKELIYKHNSYIRILGFTDTGREIIKLMKKKAQLPIIVKTADYKDKNEMFEKDILATDIAALCTNVPSKKTGGKDFTTSPVYIKN